MRSKIMSVVMSWLMIVLVLPQQGCTTGQLTNAINAVTIAASAILTNVASSQATGLTQAQKDALILYAKQGAEFSVFTTQELTSTVDPLAVQVAKIAQKATELIVPDISGLPASWQLLVTSLAIAIPVVVALLPQTQAAQQALSRAIEKAPQTYMLATQSELLQAQKKAEKVVAKAIKLRTGTK